MIKIINITSPFEKEEQPDGSFVDMIDCYDGCQLQCPYCFQLNNPNWSKNILVRTNLPEKLKENLNYNCDSELFIGSLSDPYMNLEEKYQLTRKTLQVLSKTNYKVRVTTKADNKLLLRDIDVLKSFKVPPRILLGLSSINQAGKNENNINIEIANELAEQGIDVWVFITPILPYLMDIDSMISAIDPKIPVYLDKLRVMTKGNQNIKMYNWIQRNFPKYKYKYYDILFNGNETYYKDIYEKYKDNKRITFMFEMWGI